MVATLISALLLTQMKGDNRPGYDFRQFLTEAGFKSVRVWDAEEAGYREQLSRRGAKLDVTTRSLGSIDQQRSWATPYIEDGGPPREKGSFSGMPLGSYAVHGQTDKSAFLESAADLAAARCELRYDNGAAREAADLELLEGYVRHALAQALGAKIGISKGGIGTYIEIPKAAQDAGGSIDRINERAGIVYGENKRKKKVKLVLGSRQALVDKEWIDIGGFVIEKGKKWYVPMGSPKKIFGDGLPF